MEQQQDKKKKNNKNDSTNKKRKKEEEDEDQIKKRSSSADKELNFEVRGFKDEMTKHTTLFKHLETLKDVLLLDIRNILPDEIYVENYYKCWFVTTLCRKIVEICERSILQGISENDIPQESINPNNNNNEEPIFWSFVRICEKFDDIINTLCNFRISKYHFLYHYTGSGNSKKWNIITHIFVTECYLLFCRQRMSYIIKDCPDKATSNWTLDLLNRLTNYNMVVCYSNKLIQHYFNKKNIGKDKPIIGTCLTQYELFVSIKSLTNSWNEICYSSDIDIYMNVLIYEFCHLLVNPKNERMDGQLQIDRVILKNQVESYSSSKLKIVDKYVCSCEYISNLSTIFSYFQRSLTAMNMLLLKNTIFKIKQDPIVFKLMFNENKKNTGEKKKIYKKTIINLIKWLKDENKIQQESKNITINKQYLFNLFVRSGERELFIRENNGIEASDYSSIFDLVRSPSQTNWYFVKLFENGFIKYIDQYIDSKILKDKNEEQDQEEEEDQEDDANSLKIIEYQQTYLYKLFKNHIVDFILIRIFSSYCQNELAFDWWSFCFIHENDFFQAEAKILHSTNPMILLIMGQFIVLYKRQVYLYNTSDKAILRWFIIMLSEKSSNQNRIIFDTFSHGEFDLTQLNDILETKLLIRNINELLNKKNDKEEEETDDD